MKTSIVIRELAIVLATIHLTVHAQPAGFAVTERGADYKVLQKTTVVQGTNRVHKYTELATGMNYTNNTGQWVESCEQISILPQGGAVAVQGRHKVYFPADIYNGVIVVITPDGRELRSRPVGVSYDDGSQTAWIAQLKHSIGWLTSSNQVVYRDAFTDFKADLICTYRRGGFESDLVFREQPPTPDQYGLDNSSSTIELVTEFFNTPEPGKIPGQYDEWLGLQDNTLKFGSMRMGAGKAFAVNLPDPQNQKTNSVLPKNNAPVHVYKSWLHLQGRTFLVEQLPVIAIADDLDALPLTASLTPRKSDAKPKNLLASNTRKLPPAHRLIADTNQILLASVDLKSEPGVVLDYNLVASSGDDFTFSSGETYVINGDVYLSGTTTIQGAVIKYYSNGSLHLSGPVNGSGAVFTTIQDVSVGDAGNIVPEDDPNPPLPIEENWFWNGGVMYGVALDIDGNSSGSVNLAGLQFYYAWMAISLTGGEGSSISGCSFTDCLTAINLVETDVDAADCSFSYPFSTSNIEFMGINFILRGNNFNLFDPSGPIYGPDGCLDGILAYDVRWPYDFFSPWSHIILTNSTVMGSFLPVGPLTVTVNPDLSPVGDSNTNGLPDWWELKYFGGLNQSFADMDSLNLNTLGDDYTNGVDPNIITFSLESTNNYLNTTTANLELNITAGVPKYIAVLINGSTMTNWQNFNTTNLVIGIGPPDGVYDVVVGMRGLPDDATQTWEDYSFTLDTVPPVFTITNPILVNAACTVGKPYLQLQGFANKQISALSYDISNSSGTLTNQDAFVTGQMIDTNKMDFTTNHFQAFDVPLTTNANYITLRATDRAGSMILTNFVVTLDYATVVNPPVVSIIWPPPGIRVSGSQCTIRGTIDDETGTLTAQVVNGDGTTNMVEATVERNGMFWLENVPLNGTNIIYLQAANAAGISTNFDFTILPSNLILTVDNIPAGDDLWKPFGFVRGTVNDSAATVTVNGINATVDDNDYFNNGTFYWSLDNAPINSTGTAVFDVEAVSGTGEHALKTTEKDKDAIVMIVEHHSIQSAGETSCDSVNYYASGDGRSKEYYNFYADNPPVDLLGFNAYYGHLFTSSYSVYNLSSSWQMDNYEWTDSDGMSHHMDSSGGDYYNPLSPGWDPYKAFTGLPDRIWSVAGNSGIGLYTDYVYNYFGNAVHHHWHWDYINGGYKDCDANLTARTTVKLLTGGKAKPARQNLFSIQASASEYGKPPEGGWYFTPLKGMDPSLLRVLGRRVGADGKLWISLPDNALLDISVAAPARHYNAMPINNDGVQKYPLYISLATSTVNATLNTDLPEVCVGQTVSLGAYWQGGIPPYTTIDNVCWHLPQSYVNQQTNYSATCSTYVKNDDLLTNTAMQCWYVNGKGGYCSIRETLHFANGQNVNIAATGSFTLFRPKVTFTSDGDAQVVKDTSGMPSIYLGVGVKGNNSKSGQMGWKNTVYLNKKYPASIYYTQLINRNWTWDRELYAGWGYISLSDWPGDYLLDAEVRFAGATIYSNTHNQTQVELQYDDGPSLDDPLYSFADCQDTFETYLEFQPIDGIPITVGVIEWGWHGRVDGSYSSSTWSLSTNSITGPYFYDYYDDFPEWPSVYTGQ